MARDVLVVNQFGRISRVPDALLTEVMSNGCRLVDDKDLAFLNGGGGGLEIPAIDGIEKGAWGSAPVLVVGKSDDAVTRTPKGWRRIVVNRADPRADAVVALDTPYWLSDEGQKPQAKLALKPKGVLANPDCTSFTMPLQKTGGAFEIEQANGVVTLAQFSGVIAILIAQYLSTGPVVLSGFALSGDDAAGSPYSRQLKAFTALCAMVPRVFAHPTMPGPVAAILPVWRGKREGSSDWVLIGGGPSREAARRELKGPALSVGVCNAGITVCGNPDIVWNTDPQAVIEYEGRVKFMVEHGETELCNGKSDPYEHLGPSFHGRSSGVMLLRAAIRRGARSVTLYGYDGYPDRPEVNECMGEALARVIDENPTVAIRFHNPDSIMARIALGVSV